MPERKCIKAIYFDLDTKDLQQYYPSSNWHKAYDDINKFFLANGFEHRQGSGYISQKPINNTVLLSKIESLSISNPWLEMCIKKIDVADIGDIFDVLEIVKNAKQKIIQDQFLSEEPYISEKLDKVIDISDKIERAIDNGELDKNRTIEQER